MTIGDMVRNLNSESRMTGIIVGWVRRDDGDSQVMNPQVLWADGQFTVKCEIADLAVRVVGALQKAT